MQLGRVFRSSEQSLGQNHHLLRQMWSSVLGTCGNAVLQLPGASWWAAAANTQGAERRSCAN